MHPNEQLVRTFYAAFAGGDAEGMARCYHPEVFFSDPVFPSLRGVEAGEVGGRGGIGEGIEERGGLRRRVLRSRGDARPLTPKAGSRP